MMNPIYDRVCQQHGFDPIRRRASRIAAARIVDGVTGFLRELFGFNRIKTTDLALAR